jgi:hypothetical protein
LVVDQPLGNPKVEVLLQQIFSEKSVAVLPVRLPTLGRICEDQTEVVESGSLAVEGEACVRD